MVTFYYDPTIDYHHRFPVGTALYPALYVAAQAPDDARVLFDAACAQLGLNAELSAPPGPRQTAMTIHLAKEWGLNDLAAALQTAADERYQPTWDNGEFTWGFGLNEEHPRGQYNAGMAAAEVMSEGAWRGLTTTITQDRFSQPTIVGVDFPAVALDEARWDPATRELTVGLVPLTDTGTTTFRIEQLPPGSWTLRGADGALRVNGTTAEVTVPMARQRFTVGPE